MRLYRGKVPLIAEELASSLIRDGDIEVERSAVNEVELDIEAVLNEYRRVDRNILERAKDMISQRGLDYSHIARVRKRLADKEGFGLNEQAYDWLTSQLIEALLHSRNVEEVFAEDNQLRRKMVGILRKHTELERDLDREVRAKILNLQEGTQNWEIEYEKVLGDLRQRKALD